MKVSLSLKIAAGILLLQGLLLIRIPSGLVGDFRIGGDFTGGGFLIGLVWPLVIAVTLIQMVSGGFTIWLAKPMFIAFGLIEIASSVGLYMSKKIAVYSTLIISIIWLLINLFTISSRGKYIFWDAFFIIFFGVVAYLSISCLIKNRQQSKIN